MARDATYDTAEIEKRLESLPGWRLRDGAIERCYRTSGWKATMMAVGAIGHLCEAAWHHPELLVSYGCVVVRLSTHSAKGITDKDFALAEKIEQVVGWQPGQDAGPLTGPPDDPRYAYMRRD